MLVGMRLPTPNLGQRIVLVVAFAAALHLIAGFNTYVGQGGSVEYGPPGGGIVIADYFGWSLEDVVVWLVLIAFWTFGSAWLLRDRPDPSEE